MNPIKYHLVQSDDKGALTAYVNGKLLTAVDSHANWPALVSAVTTANEDTDLDAVVRLFDPAVVVQDFFTKVSERVSVAGGHVFFDGEEINDGLSNHIVRFINEGNDATPLINFLENIMLNPSDNSRTQLFDWLSKRDFTITPEGNFLAYKGVRQRQKPGDVSDETYSNLVKYPYESISTGRAIVDGQVYNGAIPNGIGAIVEMPRNSVADDPDVACHTGLHAGNYRYASTFGQVVLIVEINPRDVVSVPHDSNSEKIRCCRYTVKDVKNAEFNTSFYGGYAEPERLDEDYSDDAPYEGDEDSSWY